MYRNKIKTIVIIAISLMILSIGFYFLSPRFHLKDIILLGETQMTRDSLFEISGIHKNKNIYLMDTELARNRVLENPYIKDITIKRRFPATLIFSVNERKETGVVPFSGGFAIIDEEGYVLRMEQNLSNIQIPIISGIKTLEVKIGQRVPVEDEEQFTTVLSFISVSQNARLLESIYEINLSDLENITMTTNNGITVLLGDGNDINYKMLQLNQILLDLFTKGIRHGIIDMRFNSYPVYREG